MDRGPSKRYVPRWFQIEAGNDRLEVVFQSTSHLMRDLRAHGSIRLDAMRELQDLRREFFGLFQVHDVTGIAHPHQGGMRYGPSDLRGNFSIALHIAIPGNDQQRRCHRV